MTVVATRPRVARVLRERADALILVSGVFLVPLAIGLTFNGSAAPDAEAYVRMSFATVAGATVAIVTVLGLVLKQILQRRAVGRISWFALIALAVTWFALNQIGNATEHLLRNLGALG